MKRSEATCDNCFFRREGLCAIPGNVPCPTYRASTAGELSPPQQPRLVPRALPRVAFGHAT